MAQINELTQIGELDNGDLFPVFDSRSERTRSVSAGEARDFFAAELTAGFAGDVKAAQDAATAAEASAQTATQSTRNIMGNVGGAMAATPGWGSVPLYLDSAIGGQGGQLNQQGQALLNRTEFLRGPDGASKIGVGSGRSQADKNSDVISVLDEGALPDSTTSSSGSDSTQAFISAVSKARAAGKEIFVPKGRGAYRLTSTVDFRGVAVNADNSELKIDHPGIGIIFGGNASSPNNPTQRFGTITRASGTGDSINPDARGIGVKGQHIHMQSCDYLQIYADTTPAVNATDYSSAYSSLYLKRVYTIELKSAPGTQGWINENNFFLNRTNKIIIASGLYSHNHNKFYSGCMEGVGLIDLPIGNNNKFYGFRFERVPSNPLEVLNINFGVDTWDNAVECSWVSSPRYTNEPYNPNSMVSVIDTGKGNSVYNIQALESDEATLFSLDRTTPFVSSINAGKTGTLNQNTDIDGVRYVRHLVNGSFKCLTSNAPLLHDGRLVSVRNGDKFAFSSDQQIFRVFVYLHDAQGRQIMDEPTGEVISMPSKQWGNNGYTVQSNVRQLFVNVTDTSIVKYIRIAIGFGPSSAGTSFDYVRLTVRKPMDSIGGPRSIFDIGEPCRVASLAYNDSTDYSIANIGEGVQCYKTDMTQMMLVMHRQRYFVKSISGNNLVVGSGVTVQYFHVPDCRVAYTDSSAENQTVAVSSVSGDTITLSSAPPVEISVGSPIDFIVFKTKTLS